MLYGKMNGAELSGSNCINASAATQANSTLSCTVQASTKESIPNSLICRGEHRFRVEPRTGEPNRWFRFGSSVIPFLLLGLWRIRQSTPSSTPSSTSPWNFSNLAMATISRIGVRGVVSGPRPTERAVGVRAWRLKATQTACVLENPPTRNAAVDILVTCYQALLMDVRDKLLFEPEYSGNTREKILPKSSLRIPWSWLPGALCLLQEVGEEKLVLNIGQAALQHPDAKPHVHDLLLSMALAECAIAKICFEKNKVSQGFEALARAQSLLRSKISLGKMPLLPQIEVSLEELAPACTLELLGMPRSPENAERRRGALAALRELLRQGLDVETPCKVQDWACFLDEALSRLMATEIIDLLPWDDLAMTRKNKKSLKSQNQRVIVDFDCFYMVLIAHIALGFSAKQMELINRAKVICECLIALDGIDLKFEEAFCLFLLGQGSEAEAVQRLHQLEVNSNSTSQSSPTRKQIKDISGASPSL
ncbi:uncharacterized protein J3R85_001131, partial [Psidium guajava]